MANILKSSAKISLCINSSFLKSPRQMFRAPILMVVPWAAVAAGAGIAEVVVVAAVFAASVVGTVDVAADFGFAGGLPAFLQPVW